MKNLLVYFSWSGNTKKLIEAISKNISFDIARIERETPYSLDYNECAYHEAKEEIDTKVHPSIKPLNININDYAEIYIFFPIWWYTFPMPIATFIDSLKEYKGKVILFANSYTNDSMYMENALRDFQGIAPGVKVEKGLFNKSCEEHINFFKRETK